MKKLISLFWVLYTSFFTVNAVAGINDISPSGNPLAEFGINANMIVTVTASNVKCFGDNNGEITVKVEQGVPPYQVTINNATYTLNSSPASVTVSGLSGGDYPIVVTDSNGEREATSQLVEEPIKLDIVISEQKNICPDESFGTIIRDIRGGWDPVAVTWYKDGALLGSPNPTKLTEGHYELVAVDFALCTSSVEVTLYKLDKIEYDGLDVTGVNCQGTNTGSVKIINPRGGATGDFIYCVKDLNDQVVPGFDYAQWPNDLISGLPEGDFIIEVKDNVATDCLPLRIPVTIDIDTGIDIDKISVTEPSCFGSNDGSIDGIRVLGNTQPLEYKLEYPDGNISGWQPSPLFNSISAGDYKVWVREITPGSCEVSKDTTIAGPKELKFENIVVDDPACMKIPQGSISFDATGGTGVLSATLNGSSLLGNLTDPIANTWHFQKELIKGGNIVVRVTDERGCNDTIMRTIPYTSDLEIDYSVIVENECPDDEIASITVLAKDILGAPHAYFVYELYRGPTSDAVYLEETITQTDITQPVVFQQLKNGTYTISVYDDRAPVPCYTPDLTVDVSNTDIVTIEDLLVIDNTCTGKAEGRLLFTIVGDPSHLKYAYSLNNGPQTEVSSDAQGRADVEILNMKGGKYTLTVYYGNCSIDKEININDLSLVLPAVTADGLTRCDHVSDGAIHINMSDPAGVRYKYWYSGLNDGDYMSFSPANGLTTSINALQAGDYKVVVQDKNGCLSDTITQNVPDVPPMSFSYTHITEALCIGKYDGVVGVTVTNGVAPYTISVLSKPSGAIDPKINPDATYDFIMENVSGGIYELLVTGSNQCSATLDIDVQVLTAVEMDITPTDASCDINGNEIPGSIHVKVKEPLSGTFVYSIDGNDENPTTDTEHIFSPLVGGSYQVKVTEQTDGCFVSEDVIIRGTEAPGITFTPSATCIGIDDGKFTFTILSGGGDYRYQLTSDGIADPAAWIDGSTGVITGLAAGDYWLLISDKLNNCVWPYPVEVSSIQELTFDILLQETPIANCVVETDLTLLPQGGTLPYKYQIDSEPEQSGPTFADVSGGYHNLVLTDAKGCRKDSVFLVTKPTVDVNIDDSKQLLSCNNDSSGYLVLKGAELYDYKWYLKDGDGTILSNTNSIYDLAAGDYVVEVSRPDGLCTVDYTFTVSAATSVEVSIDDQAHGYCPGDMVTLNGNVMITPNPGSSSYVANWILPNGETLDFSTNNPLIFVAEKGEVQLIASYNHCSDIRTHELDVTTPTLNIPVDTVYIPKGDTYILNVEASGFTNYTWESIPGGYADLPSPAGIVSLTRPEQAYQLNLTLVDDNSCTVSDSVFISFAFDLFIPNAFTPNGDGIHDTWVFHNLDQYSEFHSVDVTVYNRAGILVYEGKGYNNGSVVFNGRRGGNDLPIGTYYYVVKIGSRSITGSVTIIR
ncbi:MAG: gliding motility-associated C-terminal domain-containing protein [Bacteroidales bacterium]|jgi:gliding motility-associated-like protein|nr:gliding motility-associated C-terminal domain-containing protein [Bacteroidales bacterium]